MDRGDRHAEFDRWPGDEQRPELWAVDDSDPAGPPLSLCRIDEVRDAGGEDERRADQTAGPLPALHRCGRAAWRTWTDSPRPNRDPPRTDTAGRRRSADHHDRRNDGDADGRTRDDRATPVHHRRDGGVRRVWKVGLAAYVTNQNEPQRH